MIRFGKRLEVLHDVLYEGDNIRLLYTKFHLTVLDFAEIQYLVYQAQHSVGVACYGL